MTPASNRGGTISVHGFRQLMATFPSGVAVVAAFDEQGRPRGMTCSSLCSVTTDPPTLLACLRNGSPTLDAIMWQATFTVNLLHEGAQVTAELFASGDPHRFAKTDWQAPPDCSGPHLMDAALAVADCRVSRVCAVGDHAVVFGEVLRARSGSGRGPLLYGLRQYASWTKAAVPHRRGW